eukprot:scaffold23232_cov131-Isochrysis_galbana.AAC.4
MHMRYPRDSRDPRVSDPRDPRSRSEKRSPRSTCDPRDPEAIHAIRSTAIQIQLLIPTDIYKYKLGQPDATAHT